MLEIGLLAGERCAKKEQPLTYFNPLRFLYRFPQTSHLNGFSFSMPRVPGYGALVSGLTIEKVPSPFSCNCCVEWPWVLWYLRHC